MMDWLLRPVSELMTEDPVALDPEDPLEEAEALMAAAGTRHWPVSRDGRLVGSISLRALLAVGYRAERPDSSIVGDTMSAPPVVLDPDSEVRTAAHLMASYHFTCLPVVDGHSLIGVVTSTDFVRVAVDMLRDEADDRGLSKTVFHLMTTKPITIRADLRVEEAERIMRHGDLCHLPVVEGERLLGLLSERDLLRDTPTSPETQRAPTVAQLMRVGPIVTTENTEAMTAGSMMIHRGTGALPVLRAERLVGILTRGDFLPFLIARASSLAMSPSVGRLGSPG